MRSAELKSQVMAWQNIGSFGWIGFPGIFLWQTFLITGKNKILKSPLFYLFIIACPAILINRQWNGYLINDFVKRNYGWANVWSGSIWTSIFFFYYLGLMILSLYLLVSYRKKREEVYKKKQVSLISWTMAAGLLLGTLTDVLFPRLGLYLIPPLGSITALIWSAGLVFAVSRYGFMSINPVNAASDIITVMPEALILIDSKCKIAAVNPAGRKMLGFKKGELEGSPAAIIFNEKSNPFSEENLPSLLNKGFARYSNINLKTAAGEKIPVSFSMNIMKGKREEFYGVVSVAFDLRELIKKQEQIKKSYEKQAKIQGELNKNEKMAILGKLAGAVGHEIRTPLSSIKNVAFYLEKYGGIEDEDTRNYLKVMVEEVEKAREIVATLFKFPGDLENEGSKFNTPSVEEIEDLDGETRQGLSDDTGD